MVQTTCLDLLSFPLVRDTHLYLPQFCHYLIGIIFPCIYFFRVISYLTVLYVLQTMFAIQKAIYVQSKEELWTHSKVSNSKVLYRMPHSQSMHVL